MGDAVVLAGGQGEQFEMGPSTVRVLAEREGYALAEGTFAAKSPGPPRHRHDWDEAFYVLDGKLAITVGDEVLIAWPGDFVLAPAGTRHTFAPHGDEPARFLAMFGTRRGLTYVRELAAAFPDQGPPDEDAIAATHARYGVEVV